MLLSEEETALLKDVATLQAKLHIILWSRKGNTTVDQQATLGLPQIKRDVERALMTADSVMAAEPAALVFEKYANLTK